MTAHLLPLFFTIVIPCSDTIDANVLIKNVGNQ